MAAIVQRLERLIVVQDVEGSNPSSRPIFGEIAITELSFFSVWRHCKQSRWKKAGLYSNFFEMDNVKHSGY